MLATRTPGADGTKCETPLQHQVTKGSETGELVQPNALRSSADISAVQRRYPGAFGKITQSAKINQSSHIPLALIHFQMQLQTSARVV